ncbi:MAG: hypothetical protein AAGJ10_14920 [Bacteroidota bacterium]
MRVLAVVLAMLTVGCQRDASTPDAALLGTFVDDYGDLHTVTTELWHHQPSLRYQVLRWEADAQYLIAQNDASNASARGRFTRIDWMPLDMPPYTWAFCLSAYDAPTPEAAEAVQIADRSQPRSGCNGFPFTRLQPAPDAAAASGGAYGSLTR